MAGQIRIAVVDDQPLYREGVIFTLNQSEQFTVVASGKSAEDAVRIASEVMPEVMLLDISMPGGGLEAAEKIAKEFSDIHLIMLTVSEDEQHVSKALESGAMGYILKGVSGPELVEIVQKVVSGGAYVMPGLAARLLSAHPRATIQVDTKIEGIDSLNTREQQILSHVAKGMTNREIAAELGLSEQTVKRYLTVLLQKLQVRNRVEAALAAHKVIN